MDKGLENKREKGETPPNTQGLKPPKAQGWWVSSTRGPPKGQESSVGSGGRERSQGKATQPMQTSMAAKQPPGCTVSPYAAAQQAPGEVLVASKHLNIA